MTVFEQHTHELFQAACKKIVEPEPYKNCKLKLFSSCNYSDKRDYENAINEFMSTHCVVDIKVTQSDVSYFAYVFYKEL